MDLITENKFSYFESGAKGPNLMLLHGLFGALSNFMDLIEHFSKDYNVVVPIIPIFELPLLQVGLNGYVDHVVDFVKFKKFDKCHVLGNSLGGHIALLYALADQEHVRSITLTGSSGLFESGMGNSFPKRGDYELVDEVFEITNDRGKAIRIIATAKSAIRNNLEHKLHLINVPTLLIWGQNDNVTPPFVGEKFSELIQKSELHFIDKCGHAPMMERPLEFNRILESFLEKN